MNKIRFFLGAVAAVGLLFITADSFAQTANCSCGSAFSTSGGSGCAAGTCEVDVQDCAGGGCRNCKPGAWGCGPTGETCPTCMGCLGRAYTGPVQSLWLAGRDHFSPNPFYPYSPAGMNASWTNAWNQQQMNCRPWHGQYSYWRYQQPTALVVPPTAAHQTEYAWGVGQTKSLPIVHQFGDYGVTGGGAAEAGQFPNTPYWPSNTNQFGVYPVRSPW